MGLPMITLNSPTNEVNFIDRTIAFDVSYLDEIDALPATKFTLEVDRLNSFDSDDRKQVTYVNVASGSTIRFSIVLEPNLWYWRVKAENTSGVLVSDFRSLTISQIIKRTLYQYENIGKAPIPRSNKRTLSQYLNVGKAPIPRSNKRILYQYENVGKSGPQWNNQRGLYHYQNITDDPPFPYITKISASRGPAGSVLTIYGNGFGYSYEPDITNQVRFLRSYGGSVYIHDLLCSILSWSWNEIVFQLPAEAESGPVKVRLTAPSTRDSNVKGFEVYAGIPTDDIGIELFICARENPNTVLCQLDGAFNKAFQMVQNNAGSGNFSISRYDRLGGNSEYIRDQNFVIVKLDGNPIFKWIIETKKPNYVDPSENQIIEVSGRGVLSMLGWAVVYPENLADPVLDRSFSGTASKILRKLIQEAQMRGGLQGVAIGWENDKDSLGNLFTESISLSFRVGTPLTEVITKFTDGLGYFDIEMTPDLRLKIYKNKGEDLHDKVIYRPGQAILNHQNQSDGTSLVNEVLIEGSEKSIAVASHTDSQTTFGRREGYLSASNLLEGLSEYGQAYLSRAAYPVWGIQGTVSKFSDIEGNKIKPFETYLIGDWIGWNIPPEGHDNDGFYGAVRIKGITVSEDSDTGDLKYVLDLNNAMLEHEIKLNQKVDRMTQFSGGADVLSVAPSTSSNYSSTEVNQMITSLNTRINEKSDNEHGHDGVYAQELHLHHFTDLADTPEDYAGSAMKVVAVNREATGLEFITVAGGGGGEIGVVTELPTNPTNGQTVFMFNDNYQYLATYYGPVGKWFRVSLVGSNYPWSNLYKPEALYSLLFGDAIKNIVEVNVSTDFNSALRINGAPSSIKQLMWTFTSGTGDFAIWVGCESESGYDYAYIYIDDVDISGKIQGNVVSMYCKKTLAEGSHILKITYRKDGSGNNGYDGVQVYAVSIP